MLNIFHHLLNILHHLLWVGIIWECAALPRFQSAAEPRSPKEAQSLRGPLPELLAGKSLMCNDPSVYGVEFVYYSIDDPSVYGGTSRP